MLITIFGSCRQHSISNHFQVTNIQERLTYPHYTKEVIQAIEFCKGTLPIPPDMTRWLFRTGILDKRPLSFASYSDLFQRTDLFVIEIASRLQYKYRDWFAHHILTEDQYGFPDKPSINVSTLTDEEIESDLLQIKSLLHPKPFIIVSHIYSYKSGKRYELVELLRFLCQKHDIHFFDPIEQLGDLATDTSLFESEDILAHYSKKGHNVIGQLYKNYIDSI